MVKVTSPTDGQTLNMRLPICMIKLYREPPPSTFARLGGVLAAGWEAALQVFSKVQEVVVQEVGSSDDEQ